jgi:sugar lactone lactonase YvrE
LIVPSPSLTSPSMSDSLKIDIVGARASLWGEGPVWWQNHLWYVDIEGKGVIRVHPESEVETFWNTGERTGFLVPRSSVGWIIGGDNGLSFFNDQNGVVTPITNPEPDKTNNRFNDGKCDAQGRLWAGTISLAKITGDARLYRMTPDLALTTVHQPVTNSNGLAWSPDQRWFYYIDTPTRRVLRFTFDAEVGTISDPTTLIETNDTDSSPDGMTIDEEGHLWIAFCHGGMVRRYHHGDARILSEIHLPCVETTSVTFGGPNLDLLFITTGRHKTLVEPEAGRLFVCRPGVKGLPTNTFQG